MAEVDPGLRRDDKQGGKCFIHVVPPRSSGANCCWSWFEPGLSGTRSPKFRQPRQHLLREQGQVGDGVLVAEVAALAHHQQVAEAADVIVEGL